MKLSSKICMVKINIIDDTLMFVREKYVTSSLLSISLGNSLINVIRLMMNIINLVINKVCNSVCCWENVRYKIWDKTLIFFSCCTVWSKIECLIMIHCKREDRNRKNKDRACISCKYFVRIHSVVRALIPVSNFWRFRYVATIKSI